MNFSKKKLLIFLLIGLSKLFSQSPRTLPDSYNIVWHEQSKNSSESMPLGGGDIGCNVWVENGEVLLYVQRSGSLSENGEFLKMGRFRINLNPNPFDGENSFKQELKLIDGFIEVESEKKVGPNSLNAKIKLWVDVYRPIVHIDVESNQKINATVEYESWRTEDKELTFGKERFGAFGLEGYPGKVIRTKDIFEQTTDGILFYHRNPDQKPVPEAFVKLQGLEAYADEIKDDLKNRTFGGLLFGEGFIANGTKIGMYQNTPFKSWGLKSNTAKRKHKISIATHIAQAETVSEWKAKLLNTVESSKADHQKSIENSVLWWNDFWNRSYIVIQPGNSNPNDSIWQIGRNYQLFRYQLGGNAFGEYPTKFNGGNLTFDSGLVDEEKAHGPDWRQWGGSVFTAQNQRLLYWPMLKSGDFDAILPQFELYLKGLPGATARVKEHFGHDGAVYCEYTSVPGIAFGDGWGWQNDKNYRIRGEETPFGDPRANGAKAYNDLVEKGVMANGSIAYHWESQIEHAYMILEYHRFTGADITRYMPFIEKALIFFDEHYRARQKMRNAKELDENGKLVIFPSTSCESYRGAKNPVDVLSGLNACLTTMLTLSEKLLPSKRKEYYREYLNRIPNYAFEEVNGLRTIKPAESWIEESNQELPQFYPLFPFNQFKIGDTEIESFKNSYDLAPAFRKGTIMSWHQDGIQFARMGMTDAAADYNSKKLKNSERRYPTFWGPGHDWVPDHNWGGSGMIGLQEMLMQCFGNQILLFPAWPKTWDVNFKLHAPKNTIVEGIFKDGKIEELKVFPESRRADVRIVNHK